MDLLIVLKATFTANVGGNANHGKHFAHSCNDTLDGHVMTDFLGVDFTNRVLVIIIGGIGSKHNIIATM